MVCGVVQFHLYLDKWIYTVYIVYLNYLSMLEQATFLSLKLEFENMVMSMLIINPGYGPVCKSIIHFYPASVSI